MMEEVVRIIEYIATKLIGNQESALLMGHEFQPYIPEGGDQGIAEP